MSSFYGGQQGQNFKISKVFRNVYGTDASTSIKGDLTTLWTSSIGVGEYVFVAYGLPAGDTTSSDYTNNKNIDLTASGKTYNSTLWRKIYKETEDTEIPEDELGIEQIWNYEGTEDLPPSGWGYALVASLTGNTPLITLDEGTLLIPESTPKIDVVDVTDIDNPQWEYRVPKTPIAQAQEIVVDPAEQPNVELQKMWEIDSTQYPEDDPESWPQVDETFLFSLPRSAYFVYGNLLGLSAAGTYTISDSSFDQDPSFGVGDFYINTTQGFIYQCISKDTTNHTLTFEFLARLTSIPTGTTVTTIPTFKKEDGVWGANDFAFSVGYADSTEHTGYVLHLDAPGPVEPEVGTYTFVGSADNGSVSGHIKNASGTTTSVYQFDFEIPQGAKIFASTTQPTAADNLLNGDLWIDGTSGNVYQYNGTSWVNTGVNLVAPIAVNFYNPKLTYPSTALPSTYGSPEAALTHYFTSGGRSYPDQHTVVIVDVTDNGITTTKWYVWSGAQWNVTDLGGAAGLLVNCYQTSQNTAFSTTYTNGLIVNSSTIATDSDKKTYSGAQIDSKITNAIDAAQLEWGSFTDLIPNNP